MNRSETPPVFTSPVLNVLCAACCVLIGCATPYQQSGFQGGFSISRVDDTTYWVSFEGNTTLEANALEESLLRRAAEVTRSRGFSHFIVEDRERADSAGFVFRPGVAGPTRQTKRAVRIRCFSGHPGDPKAVDAEAFLRAQSNAANARPSL